MKIIIGLSLLLVTIPTCAQQKKIARWSVTLEGVLNRFDGDVSQTYNDLLPNSLSNVSMGGSVEYTLTPAWSIGADYYYLPLHANGKYYTLQTTLHNAGIFSAFNFIKWFYPYSRSRWGVWATTGVGLGCYAVDYHTNNHGILNPLSGLVDYSANFNDGQALYLSVGTLIEYTLSQQVALGAKIQCRGFNKDNLDGRNFWGVTNDYTELATLQLRWKPGTPKHPHVRNLNTAEFFGNHLSCPSETTATQSPKTKQLHDSLQVLSRELNDIKYQLKELATNQAHTTDTLPKPTNEWGNHSFRWGGSVYFDFDKTDLDATALESIGRVAREMQASPGLMLEIVGTADYMGHNDYNLKLSKQRSEIIRNELVKHYTINPGRISTSGVGRLTEPQQAVRINRRCDFYFIK